MSHKQIFGAQIENNMSDNHTDQREMVLLFSLLSLRCCNKQGDHEWFFFSDWLLDGPKEDKLRYSVHLLLLLCRNVSLGVSCGFFQSLSTGSKTCSIQMLWTCGGKKTFRLREKFHFICTAVAPVIQRQDTILRAATSVETRIAIGLWRLATREVIVLVVLCLELRSLLLLEYARTLFKHSVSLKTNLLNFQPAPLKWGKKYKVLREKSTFPNVVGTIDGTHIPIRAPKENHEDYFKS